MPKGVYERKGVYRNNPGETMRTCGFCHREFHHMGVGPHQLACAAKTPEQRQEYFEHTGKYAWLKVRNSARNVLIPARVQMLKSTAPAKRKNSRGLPAHTSIIEAGEKRFAVTLSFDTDTVRDVAARLLRSAKMEDVSLR